MTKSNNLEGKELSDKDLETWAKFIGLGEEPEGGYKQIERLGKHVVSLGDMTSVAKYLVDLGKADMKQYLSIAIERLTILEYIVTDKLEVDQEEMQEYMENYYKEVEEARKVMEEAQNEPEPKEEEKEVKPVSKSPCEL